MKSLKSIGVAQLDVDGDPAILRTILGSCVGICIYDRIKKIGGMAHILLPSQVKGGKPEKYADTAVPMLVELMLRKGCRKEFMSAKIVGGAKMFKFETNINLGQIGERNVEAARDALQGKEIPVVVEDTGGSIGRVLDFNLNDGSIKVKAAGKEKIYYKL